MVRLVKAGLGLNIVSLVKVVSISLAKRVFKILRNHLFVFIYFNSFLFFCGIVFVFVALLRVSILIISVWRIASSLLPVRGSCGTIHFQFQASVCVCEFVCGFTLWKGGQAQCCCCCGCSGLNWNWTVLVVLTVPLVVAVVVAVISFLHAL